MDSPMNATEDPWVWSCRWISESYSVRCLSNGGRSKRMNYLEVFANVPLRNRGFARILSAHSFTHLLN